MAPIEISIKKCLNKKSEIQKLSKVFKSNLNYYQRVAQKNLSLKSGLLVFQLSLFSPSVTFYGFTFLLYILGCMSSGK